MLEKIEFKNYQEMTQKSELFKQGLKDFREGNVKKRAGAESFWVKKSVPARDWKNYYSNQLSYCFLTKEDKNIWVGFLVANQIPRECEECSDDESRQIDEYRQAYNIMPFPLEENLKSLKLGLE